MKLCTLCKHEKEVSEFNKRSKSKDGLQPQCRDCGSAKSKSYYQNNIDKHRRVVKERNLRAKETLRRLLCDYLCDHPCIDCGETDIVVLQFDHLRDKKYNISNLVDSLTTSWETVLLEIAKCEVVCANCHIKRTCKRLNSYRVRYKSMPV